MYMFTGHAIKVRNVGNIVPHADHFEDEMTSCEPAALELGCVMNNIEHVVVCGHADCKAMDLLYTFRNKDQTAKELRKRSALRSWLYAYATETLDKFVTVNGDFSKPFLFTAETPDRKFTAYIDPENKFELIDKLSQVNTLQQLQNVASYGMLKERFRNSDLHVHALWFDIYTGDIYYFSRHAERFIVIDETSYEQIVSEVRTQGQNLGQQL